MPNFTVCKLDREPNFTVELHSLLRARNGDAERTYR